MTRSKSGSTDGRTVYRRWRLGPFEYRSDLIAHDYMRRWALITPWGMLRLHHILRSDDRAHLHDHPMDFISLILAGGYREYRPGPTAFGEGQTVRTYRPGRVVVRRAEDLHALELLRGSAWTLLLCGPIRRQWGFATEDGWVVAGEYDDYKERKLREAVRPVSDLVAALGVPRCQDIRPAFIVCNVPCRTARGCLAADCPVRIAYCDDHGGAARVAREMGEHARAAHLPPEESTP